MEENFQIFKVDANGNNIEKISHVRNKLCTSYTPWSPDGRMIVLVTYEDILILDLHGTIISKLKLIDFCGSLDWH